MLFVLTLRVSEYVVHPPDIQTLALIYKAANFWRMDRYETSCASILSRLLNYVAIDDYTQITERPLKHAKIAVELGMLPKSISILRRAFYDLARSEFVDPDQSLSAMASGDLVTLLKLQKNLIYAWDNLFTSLLPISPGPLCTRCRKKNQHPSRLNIVNTRNKYPFDPLFAIQAILSELPDFGFLEIEEAKKTLISQRSEIWNNINVWIGLDSPGRREIS